MDSIFDIPREASRRHHARQAYDRARMYGLVRYEDDIKLDIRSRMDAAHGYLERTDWYVLREIETGKPMPALIRECRAECRSKIDALRCELGVCEN